VNLTRPKRDGETLPAQTPDVVFSFFLYPAMRNNGESGHSPYPRCRFQEPTGEQHGTLERSAAVVARAHRVGHKKRHRAHRPGARVWRRGRAAETAGKRSLSVSGVRIIPKREKAEDQPRNRRQKFARPRRISASGARYLAERAGGRAPRLA